MSGRVCFVMQIPGLLVQVTGTRGKNAATAMRMQVKTTQEMTGCELKTLLLLCKISSGALEQAWMRSWGPGSLLCGFLASVSRGQKTIN